MYLRDLRLVPPDELGQLDAGYLVSILLMSKSFFHSLDGSVRIFVTKA